MAQVSTICPIALIVSYVSMLLSPTLAEPLLGSGLGVAGGDGGFGGSDCLASIKGLQACLQEAVPSIPTSQIQLVGPKCCRAFIDANNKCWPKALPLNPFFPLLVRIYCTPQLHLESSPPRHR